MRCRSVLGLVRGTFTEPIWLVQVQVGPPSRTAFPLGETRSCHHSVTHFVPNTCPMIVSKTYG